MKGFTLIELLIYILIVAVLLTALAGFGFRITQGHARTAVQRETEQNLAFALGKINQRVRHAKGVNNPLPGFSSSTLSLATDDAGKDPTIFDIDALTLILQMKEGVASPVALTTPQVRVTNLVFTNTSYPRTPGNIRTDITIEYKNPSGRSEYTDIITLSTSASLRK